MHDNHLLSESLSSNEEGQPMNTFRILSRNVGKSNSNARVGKLRLGKACSLQTPDFIMPTSRGVVPHLSPDNVSKHTGINGVFVGLEDFIEKQAPQIPPVFSFQGSLRDFICLPSQNTLILAARRCAPTAVASTNTDASIYVVTSVGSREVRVHDYIDAIKKLKPDIVVAAPDLPSSHPPGKSRWPKMPFRTDVWLKELLDKCATEIKQEQMAVFASILPLDIEKQQQYLESLVDQRDKLSGLALFDAQLAIDIPAELADLPKMSLDLPAGPLGILDQIEYGIDLFPLQFVLDATDAGIALDFELSTAFDDDKTVAARTNEEKRPLGIDMWLPDWALDLTAIKNGCECYACTNHHKAFIQHCLSAKEMTAWVLLQIHNTHILNVFFIAIRNSLTKHTFIRDKEMFEQHYQRDLPAKTGQGPRVRGYQFKSAGGGETKKNKPAFKVLGGGGPNEDEAPTPGSVDTQELEDIGFAVKAEGGP